MSQYQIYEKTRTEIMGRFQVEFCSLLTNHKLRNGQI